MSIPSPNYPVGPTGAGPLFPSQSQSQEQQSLAQQASGGASSTSPGGPYVWSDSILQVGAFSTGIHTRVLKDIAVVIVALTLLVIGLLLLSSPDITGAIKTAAKVLPLAGA